MGKRSTSFPSWRKHGGFEQPPHTALEPAVSFPDLSQRMDKWQEDCLSASPQISLQRLLGVKRVQKGQMERGCSADGWSLILSPDPIPTPALSPNLDQKEWMDGGRADRKPAVESDTYQQCHPWALNSLCLSFFSLIWGWWSNVFLGGKD